LGEDRVAYQVFGEGGVDVLWVPASGDGPIDLRWDWPPYAEFLHWLGGQARVISFDRRGAGASDPASGGALPLWEQWADDTRAVLDEVGSERAVVCGHADAGPATILFAASHPSRTRGLMLANTAARYIAAPDYPAGMPEEAIALGSKFVQDAWGTEDLAQRTTPDLVQHDPGFAGWFARGQRMYMSPREARRVMQFQLSLDVRDALALVRVPTLVLHREGIEFGLPVDHARYLAEHITGARLAIVPGKDGFIFTEPAADARRAIEEFLGGLTHVIEPDRALAAILFTDIVGSTATASALGDRQWRNLLETHDAVARTIVGQHRGRVVNTTGDGILATFDGPGRAIRCALALGEALRPLGLVIRAGLHTGEVEVRGSDIAGVGVHIAARVMDAASPGDLLVSPAVPMLVAGSGIDFEDRGEHELTGIPGSWRLFAVEP
jgi:class 3 adenylate cyclase/alpha-beta hydrolase superfamily lysophospholipase